MAFRIGQKVVCVDDKPRVHPCCALMRGETYTITAVMFDRCWGACVRVAEAKHSGRIGFFADRFRPVIEKQTDITVFTEILDRENKNSRVPVSDHQS